MNATFPPIRIQPDLQAQELDRVLDELHAPYFNSDGSWSEAYHELPYAEQMAIRGAHMARAMRRVDSLPAKPEPTAEQLQQARERQDAALRGLISATGLLNDDQMKLLGKGQRRFNRSSLK